jgi:hypothetical protein
MFALIAALVLNTQQWLPNPKVETMIFPQPEFAQCLKAAIVRQHEGSAQESIFILPLMTGREPDAEVQQFISIPYCFETDAGYAKACFEIKAVTSDPAGWQNRGINFSNGAFIVTASDLGRYARVDERQTKQPLYELDLFECRTYFGVQ